MVSIMSGDEGVLLAPEPIGKCGRRSIWFSKDGGIIALPSKAGLLAGLARNRRGLPDIGLEWSCY